MRERTGAALRVRLRAHPYAYSCGYLCRPILSPDHEYRLGDNVTRLLYAPLTLMVDW